MLSFCHFQPNIKLHLKIELVRHILLVGKKGIIIFGQNIAIRAIVGSQKLPQYCNSVLTATANRGPSPIHLVRFGCKNSHLDM